MIGREEAVSSQIGVILVEDIPFILCTSLR